MFKNLEIPEYNLNIINLNDVLSKEIEVKISNFLYDNNLSLSINSRDCKKIFQHFILNEMLLSIEENYKNIFIINYNYNTNILNSFFIQEDSKKIINEVLKKATKIFKFVIFEVEDNVIVDKNLIYNFKCLVEKQKKIDIKKIQQYCNDNDLSHLSVKLRDNLKTKLLLHK
jgi:hypothetical protein